MCFDDVASSINWALPRGLHRRQQHNFWDDFGRFWAILGDFGRIKPFPTTVVK